MPDGSIPSGSLEAFLTARDVPCPACSHNLRGVTGDTCPACGHPLHLRELLGVISLEQPMEVVASHPPLGRRAARGLAWLFGQHVVDRLLFAVQHLALAWLLSQEDYDLIALTYTVTTFASLLQQAGLGQVLVQRQKRFDRWATPVFWLSLTVGLTIGMLVAASAPLVAWFYGRGDLIGLLLVAAVIMPVSSLAVVPDARLRSDLRFGVLAMVALTNALGMVVLSIVFAWIGLGAYSFILPTPIVLCVTLTMQWSTAGARVRRRPHFRRWRHLLSDSAMLLVAQLAMMATYQGGQLTLGRLYQKETYAGTFYFALNLSDQATRLLVQNLSGVLFPTLSRLRDEVTRQTRAFVTAARALLLIGVPGCLLQAALAGPAFRLFLPQRWETAIPAFTILSFSMIGRLVYGPAESMLLAQRRMRLFMITAIVYAAGYLTAVFIGASSEHPVEGTAAGVTLSILVLSPIMLRMAIGPGGGKWSDVARAYAAPILSGLTAIAPAIALQMWLLPRSVAGDIAAIIIVPLVFSAIYIPLIRLFARGDWNEVAMRIQPIVQRAINMLTRRSHSAQT